MGVAHAQPPRGPRAGPRELIDGPEHVAGLEVEQGLRGDGRVVVDRHARVVAAGVHVAEEAAGELADQVGLERPGCVGVADGEGEVRHPAQHHALVGHRLGQPHGPAVHGQLGAAEREQLQAGRRDHDVGPQLGAGFEYHAPFGEIGDPVGDHRGPPVADDLEQVAVGHQAQPLVPRVVHRLEVGVDVVPVRQLLDRHLPDPAADHVGPAPAELVDQRGHRDVLPPGDGVPAPRAEELAQPDGDAVLGRHGQDVAGRALQHRHVLRRLGQGRDERHRGGPAADHHDPLPRVVQAGRPVLRVNNLPAEVPDAGERRQVALIVAVVAAAHQQETAGQCRRLAIRA